MTWEDLEFFFINEGSDLSYYLYFRNGELIAISRSYYDYDRYHATDSYARYFDSDLSQLIDPYSYNYYYKRSYTWCLPISLNDPYLYGSAKFNFLKTKTGYGQFGLSDSELLSSSSYGGLIKRYRTTVKLKPYYLGSYQWKYVDVIIEIRKNAILLYSCDFEYKESNSLNWYYQVLTFNTPIDTRIATNCCIKYLCNPTKYKKA